MTEIVKPGTVELRLEELTKEQLVEQVRRLQYMLEHRPDRELREKLARLETECILQGSVLDRICELLHRFGYKTPDTLSIAKAVERVFYQPIERKQSI
jgi:uncharacterized protein YPO0396